jgi:hypothetical protein
MIEHERVKMGWPRQVLFDSQWPDGIRRDNERTRESMAFHQATSVWYAGVMVGRMWGMLKVAGDPVPYCGDFRYQRHEQKMFVAGVAGRRVAFGANVLGMLQSVARYCFCRWLRSESSSPREEDWLHGCLVRDDTLLSRARHAPRTQRSVTSYRCTVCLPCLRRWPWIVYYR